MNEQRIITVLGDIPLADRIAVGRYDGYINSLIEKKNFPHDPSTVGKWECRLFHLQGISSDAAQAAMTTDGWKSGKLEHLLAFGEKYPDVQLEFPFVALGSCYVFRSRRLVPGLYGGGSGRGFGLDDWGAGWGDFSRVLGVRRVV